MCGGAIISDFIRFKEDARRGGRKVVPLDLTFDFDGISDYSESFSSSAVGDGADGPRGSLSLPILEISLPFFSMCFPLAVFLRT